MIIFAYEKYLLLLLLVPLFPLTYAVLMALRKRRIARLADKRMAAELMPSYSRARGWVKVVLFSLGFMFFTIGLARPQIGAKLSQRQTRGAEIMICLDVSNSMLAQDYSPNRLERAKLAISSLVDKLRDDRIGLIVFAGNSFVQLPITTDYVSVVDRHRGGSGSGHGDRGCAYDGGSKFQCTEREESRDNIDYRW